MGLIACLLVCFAIAARYQNLRVRGVLNNTLWDLLYVLFPLPILYFWALWIVGGISHDVYAAYIQLSLIHI